MGDVLAFNGSSTDVTMTTGIGGVTGQISTAVTVAMWVYSDDNGDVRILGGLQGDQPSPAPSYHVANLSVGTGRLPRFAVRVANDQTKVITASTAIDADTWVHVAGTYYYDSTAQQVTVELYVDGVEVESGTINSISGPDGNLATADGVRLGRPLPASINGQRFLGDQADFRLYNRALSAGEIARLAQPRYSPARQYVWGRYIDELIQQLEFTWNPGTEEFDQATYYPLSDLLYRTTALTDDSGDIVEAYDCDAYGNTLIFNAPGTGDDWWAADAVRADVPLCRYIFTGREYDAETELYYYRARYYWPVLGRFGGRDPIGYADSANLYEYVSSSPVRSLDPMGLAAWMIDKDAKWDNMTISAVKKCVAKYTREWITNKTYKMIDCADLALRALITCAKDRKLPLSIPVWNAATKKWVIYAAASDSYKDFESYVKKVTDDLGATGLYDRNKITTKCPIESLAPGDLIIYDLRHEPNRQGRYEGHTQIVTETNHPDKQITVGEGHTRLPPEETTVTYDDIKNYGKGPVDGAGRQWNWSVIGK